MDTIISDDDDDLAWTDEEYRRALLNASLRQVRAQLQMAAVIADWREAQQAAPSIAARRFACGRCPNCGADLGASVN